MKDLHTSATWLSVSGPREVRSESLGDRSRQGIRAVRDVSRAERLFPATPLWNARCLLPAKEHFSPAKRGCRTIALSDCVAWAESLNAALGVNPGATRVMGRRRTRRNELFQLAGGEGPALSSFPAARKSLHRQTAMSVRVKSVPLASNSSPVDLANA